MNGWTARPAMGVGLRAQHMTEVLARRPRDVWFEVHAENYMFDEPAAAQLERVREFAALSLHGVALSLGGADDIDIDHLKRLRHLINRLDPFLVSEHLAWSAIDGAYLSDLLPLPYTEESLKLTISHVHQVQETLDRRILIENPSRYLSFASSTIDEGTFLAELSARTGCGILCDLNNIYVSSFNIGVNSEQYLSLLPPGAVAELHLAGHSTVQTATGSFLLDDHGSEVCTDVWSMYRQALRRYGPAPTLIEWDNDLPSLSVLLDEASKARAVVDTATNWLTEALRVA